MRTSILIAILLPFSACATPLPIDNIGHPLQRRGFVSENPGLASVAANPASSASRIATGKTRLNSEPPGSSTPYVPGLTDYPGPIPSGLWWRPEPKGSSWLQPLKNARTRGYLNLRLLLSHYKEAPKGENPPFPWVSKERYLDKLSRKNTEVWKDKNAAAVDKVREWIADDNEARNLKKLFETNHQKRIDWGYWSSEKKRELMDKQRGKIWGNAAKQRYIQEWIANERLKLEEQKKKKSSPGP